MALAIDGSVGVKISPNANIANGLTLSLTTTLPNDIILIYVASEYPNQNTFAVSGINASVSFPFTRRWAYDNSGMSGGGTQQQELWWAISPLPFNGLIQILFSGYVDDLDVYAFGVNGANLSAPFDTNSSLPNKLGYNTGTGTISTTNANTMVLSFYGTPGTTDSTVMHPSGYTPGNNSFLGYVDNTGGQWFEISNVAYGINSSVQSNATWGFSSFSPGLNSTSAYATSTPSFFVVLDAIQADPAPGNFLALGFC
jgi:hypothetical protein